MSGFELTCFSSPADGISSGSVIVQVGEAKGPKVTGLPLWPPQAVVVGNDCSAGTAS